MRRSMALVSFLEEGLEHKMTLNGLPYKEYKGWYIGQGITMPAHMIYEVNVYSSRERLFAEEPSHMVNSVEEAKAWIDQKVALGG